MKITKYGKEIWHFEGKIIIYGGGEYGLQFYETIYSQVTPENLYVCDRNNMICEKFSQYIYLDDLQKFIEKYQEVCLIIAIKNEKIVKYIYDRMIYLGIVEDNIYRYIPETNEEWRGRKLKEGFFNGEKNIHIKSGDETKNLIENMIRGEKPFFYARWGSIEGKIVYRNKIGILTEKDKQEGCNNAGIFPIEDELIKGYVKITEEAARKIDILCMGFWVPQLEELYKRYSYQAIPVSAIIMPLEISVLSFAKSLKGMKVLVIHPFSTLIQKQYEKRELLFSKLGDVMILPEMELITYSAVQSMGGSTEYASWIEALEKMERDILGIDFDVALIGCGAYGMPLGAFIKEKMRKKAIHVGGALQLLFGIKGRRWDERGYETWLYNEHWVYPTEDLRPLNYKSVENGCYW